MEHIDFCGITFKGLTKEKCLLDDGCFKQIVTVNSEFIVRAQEDDEFKTLINQGVATFDGQIPYFLAKLKHSNSKFEKIAGSDFIYDVCEYARKHHKKVFLLGGKEESNAISVSKLREKYGIDIEGYSPPYAPYPFPEELNKVILSKIARVKPHFLFVGFGAVKQDRWIFEHKGLLEQFGVRCAVGSGGTFEFVSEQIKRAPKLFQRIGLEGVWRLIAEPSLFRFRRILVSCRIFYYYFKL